jgi:hypothetical protein
LVIRRPLFKKDKIPFIRLAPDLTQISLITAAEVGEKKTHQKLI